MDGDELVPIELDEAIEVVFRVLADENRMMGREGSLVEWRLMGYEVVAVMIDYAPHPREFEPKLGAWQRRLIIADRKYSMNSMILRQWHNDH